jgi:hypothetical protein
VAYDNVTDGFKKLYHPNPGSPWENEGAENLQKQDDLEIMLIANDGGGMAIDLGGFGASTLWVITNRELQVDTPNPGDDAEFSFGMAPLFKAAAPGSSLNAPWAPVGVRAPGFLHTFVGDFIIPAASFVGMDPPIPPGLPPAMAQFIIWERDSQGALYKIAECSHPVMFAGGPP